MTNIMRSFPSYLLLPLLFLFTSGCHGGKILVSPVEGSHWVNMDILIRALHDQGHSITVVRTTKSWYIKEDSPYYDSITVSVKRGFDKEFVKPIVLKLMEVEKGRSSFINNLLLNQVKVSAMSKAHYVACEMVLSMFEDRSIMQRLKESQFDLVLTDPAFGEGILLAHYLKVPLVYYVRWLLHMEGHFDLAPSPVSYIPIPGSGLSDKMAFTERVKNMLFHFLVEFSFRPTIQAHYQAVCDKHFEPKVDFQDLILAADIWLMRVDFVFEFPRPTMPNVVYMGGFQCTPAKPLPQDLEDFVQSSGENGFIIMSFGTFVTDIPVDMAENIAAAFAELPQKVIWRHVGGKPSSLGNNTLLVNWMPQNDLLGHPKIRAFVAHGGTNGVQEALYHGVPILGIPLLYDQYDNLLRLRERGGAKMLTTESINKDSFLQALQEVLHEPSYRGNMQRLSRLHRDQPMKPLDRAIFWIEFVMRHKGAAHLRTESYKMPWYSYHSVDVILFLLAVVTTFVGAFVFGVKFLCTWICCKQKSKQE